MLSFFFSSLRFVYVRNRIQVKNHYLSLFHLFTIPYHHPHHRFSFDVSVHRRCLCCVVDIAFSTHVTLFHTNMFELTIPTCEWEYRFDDKKDDLWKKSSSSSSPHFITLTSSYSSTCIHTLILFISSLKKTFHFHWMLIR